jgi:hypothetical protein
MNNLKKLFVAISLTIMLAGTTLADCPAPIPGEVNTPPCTSTQQLNEDSADRTTTATTTSSEAEIVIIDTVIAALENLLTVY